jgi:MYXO-CTERM domain-containing protein
MNMKKLFGIGFAAAMFVSQAHAGFIWGVTGSDMAGIKVTATFADTSTETFTWADLGGDAGGVTGTGWSLMVDGDTIIPNPASPYAGAWTLVNNTQQMLESLFINLGAGFVFDTEFGDASANGSGPGRALTSSVSIGSLFGGWVQDELYSTLWLTDIADGTTLFGVDTDAVPTPATISLLGLAMLGLAAGARRRKA